MAMGMPRDEYWNGNIFDAFDYAEAYRMKLKADNERNWLQGLYVYDAVASILSQMFAKKGEQGKSYAERPYELYGEETDEDVQREQETEKLQAQIWMQRFVEYGKNWGEK